MLRWWQGTGLIVRLLLLLEVQHLSNHFLGTVVSSLVATETETNEGGWSGNRKNKCGLLDGRKGFTFILGLPVR